MVRQAGCYCRVTKPCPGISQGTRSQWTVGVGRYAISTHAALSVLRIISPSSKSRARNTRALPCLRGVWWGSRRGGFVRPPDWPALSVDGFPSITEEESVICTVSSRLRGPMLLSQPRPRSQVRLPPFFFFRKCHVKVRGVTSSSHLQHRHHLTSPEHAPQRQASTLHHQARTLENLSRQGLRQRDASMAWRLLRLFFFLALIRACPSLLSLAHSSASHTIPPSRQAAPASFHKLLHRSLVGTATQRPPPSSHGLAGNTSPGELFTRFTVSLAQADFCQPADFCSCAKAHSTVARSFPAEGTVVTFHCVDVVNSGGTLCCSG